MRISFAPLEPDAVQYLTDGIGVNFSYGRFDQPNWLCCTGRDDDGALMGVVACEFRNPFDATFNLVVTDPRCISRRVMRAIFTALFSRAVRLTAEISVNNRDALRAVRRLGFVYEGYCRLGYNGVEDAFVYGMLREDCRFLPGYSGGTTTVMELPHGQDAVFA